MWLYNNEKACYSHSVKNEIADFHEHQWKWTFYAYYSIYVRRCQERTVTMKKETMTQAEREAINAEIIGYFNKGERVSILDSSNGWYKVRRSDNSIGWVMGDYCKPQ